MIDFVTTTLVEQLSTNEFFQGGFVLALIGVAGVWGKKVPAVLWAFAKRRMIVECDVQQGSATFDALVAWLAEHPYGRRVKRFSATLEDVPGSHHNEKVVQLSPAPGTHWIWYDGRLVRIERGREKIKSGGGDLLAGFYESFTLQTFGRGRSALESLVRDAVAAREHSLVGHTRVLTYNGYTDWNETTTPPNRPLDSVVLADEVMGDLLADVQDFLDSRKWYESMGIPYRRGFLFHGPPGTGKSSTALALAAHFGLDVACLGLSDRDLTDVKLAKTAANAPSGSILLLEDLDCLFDEDRGAKDSERATLSGLLNVLDGALAQHGRVVVMTTNHPERVDSALRRPGKADVVVEFRMASTNQARVMFDRFFPDAPVELAFQFGHKVGEEKLSPAEVQQHLMLHRGSAEDALREVNA